MELQLQYFAEFYGRGDGHVWRVEILRRADRPFDTVRQLLAADDAPCVIDWRADELHAPVHGAVCTVRVISPEDRLLTDLYTVAPGAIAVRVLCDGSLFWTGTMDPEFYEEPYECADGYEVELKFTDFGILNRIDFEAGGLLTLSAVLRACLDGAGLEECETDTSGISASLLKTDGSAVPLSLDHIAIPAANFYDEEGEPSTLRQVLEGILQPLALRVEQRCGKVWVYDLHGLTAKGDTRHTVLNNNGMLAAGQVSTLARVTFSPYADKELIAPELNRDKVLKDKVGVTFYVDFSHFRDPDESAEGFDIVSGPVDGSAGTNWLPVTLGGGARLCRIDSVFSGTDEACIAFMYKGNNNRNYEDYLCGSSVPVVNPGAWRTAMITTRTAPVYIADTDPRGRYTSGGYLRIKLQVCFDVRYNPFEAAGVDNEEGDYNRMQKALNYAYIPARLHLLDDSGRVLYHYVNISMTGEPASSGSGPAKMARFGTWVAGDYNGTAADSMQLTWYDSTDQRKATGWGGWSTNRQSVGLRTRLPGFFSKIGDGELIPLPPVSGNIRLQIGEGFWYRCASEPGCNTGFNADSLRWMLYRLPSVELVDERYSDPDDEDVEFTAWINRNAADEVSIDTVCGSVAAGENRPGARGVFLTDVDSEGTWRQLSAMRRGGNDGRPEELLMATLINQYDTPHTTLSGEADIDPGEPVLRTVNAQDADRRFFVQGERIDARAAVAELTLVELSPDNFQILIPED